MKRTLLILSAAALLLFATFGVAQAAGPKKDIATPSRACAILAQNPQSGYTSFADCMRTFNKDMRAYRFFSDETDPTSPLIGLDQRCTDLEGMGISYPFWFTEGGIDAGWYWPELTAYNHHQCEITLFTYHKLVGL